MTTQPRHLSLAELDSGWRALPPAPRDRGTLALILRRPAEGVRETPARVVLDRELGVPGDAWGRQLGPRELDTQLAVMNRALATLIAAGQPLTTFGDNLYVDLDLSAANLPPGTQLRIGGALVEMTPEPHDGCRKFNARFGNDALKFVQRKETRGQNFRGVYWRVIEPGEISVGDAIEVLR
ncbi:MAG TPA: MOSC domain-containing protein [Myxococcota bacterium]|nr:MOSC domain-containing protein [Myxococcota bacterium]